MSDASANALLSGGRTGSATRRDRALKRALDVVLSGCGLIVLVPVMLIVVIAIRLSLGSPVLFRQERPGLDGRPFELLKFRSMRPATDPFGRQRSMDERIMRVGAILRRTSLDELPELWNILKGDMSVVGPRPLLMEYLPRYTPTQLRRHEVRPGLTGLAQVSGRHELGWSDRFALDVWYVDHWDLRLDLRIMWATVRNILNGSGMLDETAADFEFTGAEDREVTGDTWPGS